MRDVVLPTNDFRSATLQRPKKSILPNTSTLYRGDYKCYRGFLGNYDKKCKDDQESVSSTDSGMSSNTSASSLHSDISKTASFKNYLDGYANKKFTSVRPPKNTVKSELVIQIKDPSEGHNQDHADGVTNNHGHVIRVLSQIQNGNPLSKPPLVKHSHLFPLTLSNSPPTLSSTTSSPPLSPPILSPCPSSSSSPIPPPLVFDEKFIPPPPPPLLPEAFIPPPPPLGDYNCKRGKKWSTVEIDGCQSNKAQEVPQNAAAANLAKILTGHLMPRGRDQKDETIDSRISNLKISKEQHSSQTQCSELLSHPILKRVNSSSGFPKQNEEQAAKECVPAKNYMATSPSMQAESNKKVDVASSEFKKVIAPKPSQFTSRRRSNGQNTIDYDTRTVVPVPDSSSKVNKTDPNVRKLVYNTYRGLLGAYNNKANDMIATLPRTMVREDRGINKQLESMALQGGLEKLNGRTNPKLEE